MSRHPPSEKASVTLILRAQEARPPSKSQKTASFPTFVPRLQVLDSDFDRAAKRGTESGTRAAQNPAASNRVGLQETTQALGVQGLVPFDTIECDSMHSCTLPPRGIEPLFSD